ncbi:MAG: tRNA uridine-5-carboxymethylaminomethyl(34) synthesis GTPase MnmE [Synergistaceae bacterium]|jgi:tRNA modification GTPase|nr:tRNA uridine-5-carboxymethylaminomethyl(34) synthesis GTPase MnmE [Synergistaceae bacterium]
MPFDGGVIAAVATAWGEAAIAIIRLSGEGSAALADNFFRGARPLSLETPRRMILGNISDGADVVDQVLAVRFERGSSYTGEESVEVHCHGGMGAARRCLGLFMKGGARPALPGEFTKRAFLSGRIDLAQAEAVLGVIRARSDAELASSSRALQGELSACVRKLSGRLTSLLAEIEARIDFPDDVDGAEYAGFKTVAYETKEKTLALLERCRVGMTLRNGVRVAIVGRPNAGKSSLLNAMLESDRAIVTNIPGTTRDTLDAVLIHRGLAVTLVDTAGLRESTPASGAGVIESIGVERSLNAIKGADLCLLVVDVSSPLTGEDFAASEAALEKPAILAANKSDLRSVLADDELEALGNFTARLGVSAITGAGVNDLKNAVFEAVLGLASPSDGMMATGRMVNALEEAAKLMDDAARILGTSRCMDVAGSLLLEAAEFLSSLLGTDASEALLDEIFSAFCIGK